MGKGSTIDGIEAGGRGLIANGLMPDTGNWEIIGVCNDVPSAFNLTAEQKAELIEAARIQHEEMCRLHMERKNAQGNSQS